LAWKKSENRLRLSLVGAAGLRAQAPSFTWACKMNYLPARKAHPAFLVADLEHLRETLAAAGVPISPDCTLPGVRRFYAADPFGNRIEFIQDGDGFSQPSS
jgi:catechol 2,3-dioxygenase-like lactoylglutathione lyase family enzyme